MRFGPGLVVVALLMLLGAAALCALTGSTEILDAVWNVIWHA